MGWEVKTNMGGQTEHVQCQNRKIFTWKDLRDEICGEAFSQGMKLKNTGIINVPRESHGLNIHVQTFQFLKWPLSPKC